MRRSSLMPRFEVLHDLVAVELGWTPLIWMRALPVMGCSEQRRASLKLSLIGPACKLQEMVPPDAASPPSSRSS